MCLCVYWFRNVRLCVCVGVYVCVFYYVGVCMHGFVMCGFVVCVCMCEFCNVWVCVCDCFVICICVKVWIL